MKLTLLLSLVLALGGCSASFESGPRKYGYSERSHNGAVDCNMPVGDGRLERWTEMGNTCHANPSERIPVQ